MLQLKCRMWLLRSINRKWWMQAQGIGSLNVPWAQLPQGQSGGWRGSKDREKRSQSNPLKCNFQHQSWGFSNRQKSPQCHRVRHRVQDMQLSQNLGVSKPLFVTWFALGTGLRKVENSCINCKSLFKNHTAFQVKNRFMLVTNLLVNLLESLQWFFTEIVRYRSVKVYKIFNISFLIML